MPEQLHPPLDIDDHFNRILSSQGETIPVDFSVPTLEGHEDKDYSVFRSDGSIDRGWQAYDKVDSTVRLKKPGVDERGQPVTLTKSVNEIAFVQTQTVAERLAAQERPVSAEMAKRALMVQTVMARKRRDPYPYDHRDDLHVA